MNYKSLDYIVKNVILQKYEENDVRYPLYFQLGVRGVRELSFLIPKTYVKTVLLPYDRATQFLDCPVDCVKWRKLGRVIGDKLICFTQNNKRPLSVKTNDCGENLPLEPLAQNQNQNGCGEYGFANYYYNGFYGGLYGVGGGAAYETEYVYNQEYNRFEFGNAIDTDFIYLEYETNGIPADGAIMVPETAIETLISWVNWQSLINKPGERANAAQMQEIYKQNLRYLRGRAYRFSITDFYNTMMHSFIQAPKF